MPSILIYTPNCPKIYKRMKVVQLFIFILIALVSFIPNKGYAQETVFVHLDKDVVVSGESVFFKAYSLNSNHSKLNPGSRILYIQITDPVTKKNLVFRSDVNKNGICFGEIPIPDTLKTARYLLTAFTNQMRNLSPGQVFTTRILVINQAQNITEEINNIAFLELSDSISNATLIRNNSSKSIDITLNKRSFGTREKVEIDLKNLADSLTISSVSITVTRKSPFESSGSVENNICTYLPYMAGKLGEEKDQLKSHLETVICRFPAEDQGFILSGSLLEKSSRKPLNNVHVLLSVPDSVANLKYAVTDSSGKFNFLLGSNYNNRELILQLMNPPSPVENTTIVIGNKSFSPDAYNLQKENFDSTGLKFVTDCQKLAMVTKIYTSGTKNETTAKNLPLQNYSFFGKSDEIIKPSDFVEMPNMEDIVANIVRNAKYKVTEDQSIVLVVDELSHQFREGHNALVLLNNIPVFDYGVINSLGTKQIERIELKTKHMYFGDLEIFGILSIFTKENYIPYLKSGNKVFSFSNEVLKPVKSKNDPDYSLKNGKNSKIPDFRQTLYWNPDFELKNKGTIEFYTSDLKTSYDVVIQGITQNGIPLSARTTIEVR